MSQAGDGGLERDARSLLESCEVIDLHIDTMIPARIFGYDPLRRHGQGISRGRLFGHLDLPRIEEGGLTGAMWSITTQPFRTASNRWRAFLSNLARLEALAKASDGRLAIARDAAEYRAARARGAHVILPAIQGGNALEGAPQGVASIPGNAITRVTLVHLTDSCYGTTSSPLRLGRDRGLGKRGHELIEQLDASRVFVDLAHISRPAFFEAVDAHDPSAPLIVTHTGVTGVRPHWRNLEDDQLRAIADTGGTIGIMFHQGFLRRAQGPKDADMVLEHMEYVAETVGDDFVSIGTDYDGFITPPRDLRDGLGYATLVERMIARGWPEDRIRGALGGNALRALALIRPGVAPSETP
jgi:membrane dipeptidase